MTTDRHDHLPGQVGGVFGHCGPQGIGIAHDGQDLEAEPFEEAGAPFPEQDGILGHDDPDGV